METIYTGFYACFNTRTKKDGALLLSSDCLVGDIYDIVFTVEQTTSLAWMKNRFGALVAYFDQETSERLRLFTARNWKLQALLSFVAFTDHPEPGFYWGESAILCYNKRYIHEFQHFSEGIARRLQEGLRPDINLGEQATRYIVDSCGNWQPKSNIPFPERRAGTVIIKSRRKSLEKLIEQGRQKKIGCYALSILFLVFLGGLILLVFNYSFSE